VAANNKAPYRLHRRGQIWHAYISTRVAGRRVVIRASTGCSERERADKWCIDRLHSLEQAPEITHEITLDAAAARWFIEVGQYQAQSSSREYILDILLREMNKNALLSDITKGDIINFIAGCRMKKRKPATINRYLAALSALFTRAHDYWDCKIPGFKLSQFKQKEPVENVKYFSLTEVEKIIENAANHIKPIIWTGLYTGLRRGRILGLKWSQVDFENMQIVFTGKNGLNQSVPIVAPLMDILKSLPRNSEFVFTNRGENIKDIKEAWRGALKRAGVQYKCFHTLRHTFATLLLQNTKDLRLVKEACGHGSIGVTMKYAHLINGRVAEGMNQLFEKRS
jgi:integrase